MSAFPRVSTETAVGHKGGHRQAVGQAAGSAEGKADLDEPSPLQVIVQPMMHAQRQRRKARAGVKTRMRVDGVVCYVILFGTFLAPFVAVGAGADEAGEQAPAEQAHQEGGVPLGPSCACAAPTTAWTPLGGPRVSCEIS